MNFLLKNKSVELIVLDFRNRGQIQSLSTFNKFRANRNVSLRLNIFGDFFNKNKKNLKEKFFDLESVYLLESNGKRIRFALNITVQSLYSRYTRFHHYWQSNDKNRLQDNTETPFPFCCCA